MSWFSFLRKDKHEPAPDASDFYSQAEDVAYTGRAKGRGKSKDDAPDPELPEKKRARRRLIGAVALTLGLVIGLPMLLDSEPRLVTDDVVIQIPSRDKLSKLNASRPSASVAVAATPDKSNETPPPAVAPVTSSTTPAASSPLKDKPVAADKPATAKPLPEAQKSVKADAVENKTKAAADTASDKVVIQLAALATQDKVNELQSKLTKAGFKSHTQKVATKDGERIRVRVGPYANKAEAEKLCPKLVKMNLKCTILSN